MSCATDMIATTTPLLFFRCSMRTRANSWPILIHHQALQCKLKHGTNPKVCNWVPMNGHCFYLLLHIRWTSWMDSSLQGSCTQQWDAILKGKSGGLQQNELLQQKCAFLTSQVLLVGTQVSRSGWLLVCCTSHFPTLGQNTDTYVVK